MGEDNTVDDHAPGYSMFFDLRNRRDDADKNRLIESLRLSPEEVLAVLTRDGQYRKEMAGVCLEIHGAVRRQPVCLAARATACASTLTDAPSRAWASARRS